MRCSVHLSPRILEDEHYAPVRQALTEQALEADRAGFAGIVLTEHHLSTHNPYQNPLLFGCALAPQIKRAHIVLATINPAIYHPLRLVESLNLLDQLLEGRLVVVFGPGYVDYELRAFGRDPADRARLFSDALATTMELWRMQHGDLPISFDVAGERGLVHRPVLPPSFRRPHPLVGRATLTESTIGEMAKLGWPVVMATSDLEQVAQRMQSYAEILNSSGHAAETIANARRWTGLPRWIHVGRSDAEAEAQVTVTIERWLSDRRDTTVATDPGAVSPNAPTNSIEKRRAAMPKDPVAFRAQVIHGSPATVTAALRKLEEAGVGHVLGLFMRDAGELDQVRTSFRLFCDQVLPSFRD